MAQHGQMQYYYDWLQESKSTLGKSIESGLQNVKAIIANMEGGNMPAWLSLACNMRCSDSMATLLSVLF